MSSSSFPFLALARQLNIPYATVLYVVESCWHAPLAELVGMANCGIILVEHVSRVVLDEKARRDGCIE